MACGAARGTRRGVRLDHRRGGDHVRGRHLCGARRDVSRVGRGRALRTLLARLARRVRSRLGRVDRHRFGDPGRGGGLGAIHEFLAVELGPAPLRSCGAGPRRADAAGSCDLRRAGGALFSGKFLEREGIRRYEQRHHLLQAHRAGRHGGRTHVHRVPPRQLPYRHPWRPARGRSCLHSHGRRHQRHRVQLQRISKSRESRGRSASPRTQHSHRDLRLAPFEHGGVPFVAGRILERGGARAPE